MPQGGVNQQHRDWARHVGDCREMLKGLGEGVGRESGWRLVGKEGEGGEDVGDLMRGGSGERMDQRGGEGDSHQQDEGGASNMAESVDAEGNEGSQPLLE